MKHGYFFSLGSAAALAYTVCSCIRWQCSDSKRASLPKGISKSQRAVQRASLQGHLQKPVSSQGELRSPHARQYARHTPSSPRYGFDVVNQFLEGGLGQPSPRQCFFGGVIHPQQKS